MNRSDFLMQLREALENEMSAGEVQENVDFYNRYIQEELDAGKSEEEVMDMLGDPWAIAKTVLMSSGMGRNGGEAVYEDVEEAKEDRTCNNAKVHVVGLDAWWKKAVLAVSVIVIFLLIIGIIMGLITVVLPIVLPVLIVLFIVRLFQRK